MGGTAVPAAAIADAVAATRAYLRLTGDEEDALLARLAASAIDTAEAYCGEAILARGGEEVLPAAAGGWQALARRPVTRIEAVAGLAADGAPFALPVDAYAIDVDADGTGWVRVARPGAAGRIAVRYAAGRAAGWDAVAPPVAQGIAMLAAHLFEHREADAMPPAAVAALWRPFRRLRLAVERRA